MSLPCFFLCLSLVMWCFNESHIGRDIFGFSTMIAGILIIYTENLVTVFMVNRALRFYCIHQYRDCDK